MILNIEYCVKIPFMDSWLYLTETVGKQVSRVFFDTYEAAEAKAIEWNGKVVTVTFEDDL